MAVTAAFSFGRLIDDRGRRLPLPGHPFTGIGARPITKGCLADFIDTLVDIARRDWCDGQLPQKKTGGEERRQSDHG